MTKESEQHPKMMDLEVTAKTVATNTVSFASDSHQKMHHARRAQCPGSHMGNLCVHQDAQQGLEGGFAAKASNPYQKSHFSLPDNIKRSFVTDD